MKKILKRLGVALGILLILAAATLAYFMFNMPPLWGTEPHWSWDGTKVVYRAQPLHGEGTPEFFVLDTATRLVTPLTDDGVRKHYPMWSPSGHEIAFTAYLDKQWMLCLMPTHADARPHCPVKLATKFPTRPAWSPDGKKIAIAAKRNGQQDIFVVQPGDTTLVNLTNHSAPDDQPTWSPDGHSIVFTSRREKKPNLWRMQSDGSNSHALFPATSRNDMAQWMPDPLQRKLAFISNRSGQNDVFVWDEKSGETTQVTFGPDRHFYPTWSPGGRQLIYMITSFTEPTALFLHDFLAASPEILAPR